MTKVTAFDLYMNNAEARIARDDQVIAKLKGALKALLDETALQYHECDFPNCPVKKARQVMEDLS